MKTKHGGFGAYYIRWHFPFFSTILLLLSLVAFWDNLVSDVTQPSNSDPRMIFHGLFLLAWMILLVVQASLPAFGRVALHRKIGPWTMLIGLGVVLSTLFLFVAVWRGWDALRPQILANRLFLALFAASIFAAWRMRYRADWHKRLIYVGTLFMIEPVVSRTYDPLIAPFMPPYPPGEDLHLFLAYLFGLWFAFYLCLFLYDWLSLRRLHPVTIGGFATTVAVIVLALTVAPAPI